ncbi:MAG: Maf family nucleotide pyrophosphatase [Gammaproteobacteria bacterium]|jgi:septum formation protein|nr:Maf family nucleotide pyrophosphatase [Gammaproteobacteria bacterium]MDP6615870.1 Maf family nucleotide pyrophosphatase [Gammaproteobacteria bacterium]MDP6694312.1 Maf family nucleotide pyrophosphatase [Gammaproteobacteria bacterium]MDP7041063.1 Maf family nucleotide pyrophosphatase [Gammaproteobacteria bacterium]
MKSGPPKLVLASGSEYRRKLLSRICGNFECVSPQVDETPRDGEKPAGLANRLAIAKARSVAEAQPADLVIGSDQVADLHGNPLGKPGDHATAAKQLAACSGQEVVFHTAVCICSVETGLEETCVDRTIVEFRDLSEAEIDRYLEKDKPWDCAGSFRSEGLGAVLFRSVSSSDPTALIGLPLIWVAAALRRAKFPLL